MSEQAALDPAYPGQATGSEMRACTSSHNARTARLDRRLAARGGVALVLANARYWSCVAAVVRHELARWHRRALAIENPILRSLALEKLAEEGFNAEVAATLATLVARSRRRAVIEAIVALEVLFDFLDGLTESPVSATGLDGQRLSRALTDAVDLAGVAYADYYALHAQGEDGGYLSDLVTTVRASIATLPASARLADLLLAAARRSAEAQLRIHAAASAGRGDLEQWARAQAGETPEQWRELLAGAASSVLCLHALIAAAADPRCTHEQGHQIDQTYLWVAALPTILDSLIDSSRDTRAGHAGFITLYESSEALASGLQHVAGTAIDHARSAPHTAHHVMTLVGVLAYYGSAASACDAHARRAIEPTARQLRPLIGPTLAVMRAWRLTKRIARRRGQAPTASRGRAS